MLKDGMTGAMRLWLDTSKPAPVRINRVDYIAPINEALVKSLYEKVLSERSQRFTGLKAQQRVERFEMRAGLKAFNGET